MPDLPDLPTNNISFIAYFNAIDDGGASSIDPETALTNPNINSYTIYDNGIQIDSYDGIGHHDFKARIKTDGWILAWFEAGAEQSSGDGSDFPKGWYDIVGEWVREVNDSISLPSTNPLYDGIESLANSLDSSTVITYSTGKTGLYFYENEDVRAVTIMANIQNSGNSSTKTGTFSYTSDTTIHEAFLVASLEASGYLNFVRMDSPIYGSPEVYASSDTNRWAATNIKNDIPDAGTDYDLILEPGNKFDYDFLGAVIILWS